MCFYHHLFRKKAVTIFDVYQVRML